MILTVGTAETLKGKGRGGVGRQGMTMRRFLKKKEGRSRTDEDEDIDTVHGPTNAVCTGKSDGALGVLAITMKTVFLLGISGTGRVRMRRITLGIDIEAMATALRTGGDGTGAVQRLLDDIRARDVHGRKHSQIQTMLQKVLCASHPQVIGRPNFVANSRLNIN